MYSASKRLVRVVGVSSAAKRPFTSATRACALLLRSTVAICTASCNVLMGRESSNSEISTVTPGEYAAGKECWSERCFQAWSSPLGKAVKQRVCKVLSDAPIGPEVLLLQVNLLVEDSA